MRARARPISKLRGPFPARAVHPDRSSKKPSPPNSSRSSSAMRGFASHSKALARGRRRPRTAWNVSCSKWRRWQGAAFGSLVKIASGGELARFSLALKVALAETSPPAALVFDEVDRGVGGAVADAVGERLQRVARTTQVLLVTHSPQVAARAGRHFRITRLGERTRIELLTDEARIEEIARMLSGAAVTEEARAAARRLVAEASPQPRPRKRA